MSENQPDTLPGTNALRVRPADAILELWDVVPATLEEQRAFGKRLAAKFTSERDALFNAGEGFKVAGRKARKMQLESERGGR